MTLHTCLQGPLSRGDDTRVRHGSHHPGSDLEAEEKGGGQTGMQEPLSWVTSYMDSWVTPPQHSGPIHSSSDMKEETESRETQGKKGREERWMDAWMDKWTDRQDEWVDAAQQAG